MKCRYCNGTGEHINDANRMTTCEFCGGTGEVEVVGDSITDVCDKCGGPGEVELTNEEYIRTCSTEELVNFLSKGSFCDFCPYQLSAQCSWKDGDCAYGDKNNEECFNEWLKEKHE